MRYARPLIAGSAAVLAAILGATAAFAATMRQPMIPRTPGAMVTARSNG